MFYFLVRPRKVKILNPPMGLSVGQKYTIKCVTSGSSPPADLLWLKKGEKFGSVKSKVRN